MWARLVECFGGGRRRWSSMPSLISSFQQKIEVSHYSSTAQLLKCGKAIHWNKSTVRNGNSRKSCLLCSYSQLDRHGYTESSSSQTTGWLMGGWRPHPPTHPPTGRWFNLETDDGWTVIMEGKAMLRMRSKASASEGLAVAVCITFVHFMENYVTTLWSSLQTWSTVENCESTSDVQSLKRLQPLCKIVSMPAFFFHILDMVTRPFSSVASCSWCFQQPNEEIAYSYIHLSRRPLT